MQKIHFRHPNDRGNSFALPVNQGSGRAHPIMDKPFDKPFNRSQTEHGVVFSKALQGRAARFHFVRHASPAMVIYGPGSRPLFYTALLQPPRHLIWGVIPNTTACRVSLGMVSREAGTAVMWSSFANCQDGFSWLVPDLGLHSGCHYRWRIKPQSAADLEMRLPNLSLPEPHGVREARFWLLPAGSLERIQSGLNLIRERSDPQFLPLAEAMFLAEYQLYQDALTRLPLFDATRTQAHSLLYETTRSIIFRQMIRHMGQQPDLPPCFLEWATKNEQYHRRLTQNQIPGHPAAAMTNQ